MSEEVKALILTDTCPHCAEVKKALADRGLIDKVQIINASTKEGLDFAMSHGIRSVPECVIITKKGEQVRVCTEQEFIKVLGGK